MGLLLSYNGTYTKSSFSNLLPLKLLQAPTSLFSFSLPPFFLICTLCYVRYSSICYSETQKTQIDLVSTMLSSPNEHYKVTIATELFTNVKNCATVSQPVFAQRFVHLLRALQVHA